MSLIELFPTYPFNLRNQRKYKIKFGTRRLYVDLPWQSYSFLQVAMSTGLSTTEEVREEWRKFLQNYNNSLVFNGKPLVSISLRTTPSSKKAFLRLDVKWNLFLEYLEEKATGFLLEIENGEENVMKVYREIWINLFMISGEITPVAPQYFPSTRERFRKLLRRTGDYSYIKNLLDQLEEIMKNVEKRMDKNKIPSIQLYTTNLVMDIQHLRELIDVVDIPAAYLLLRNLLENFVKIFVYLDIGKSTDYSEVILSSMFFYEYEQSEPSKQRVKSLKEFKESGKIILEVVSVLPPNEDVIKKLKEKQIRTLWIDRKVLKEFSVDNGLNINLDMLYSACSKIIHNQPPLPFFSLLEVKFFKHFLDKYIQSMHAIAEKLVDEKIELKKTQNSPQLNDIQSLKKSLQVADFLEREYGNTEIKDMIKRTLITLQKEESHIFVKPFILISFFHLISPPRKLLRSFSFGEEDLEDIYEKLSPISFNTSILKHVIPSSLNKFQEIMLPDLEKYKAFSSLFSSEQKKKVIFYLLLNHLPEIVEKL